MEQIMARLLAEIRTNREEMTAIQERMEEKLVAEIKTVQEKPFKKR
jgi:hypothetical protein